MPDRWGTIQLGFLLLVVPAQYIISTYMANSETQRQFALKKIISNVAEIKTRYLTFSEWQKWCLDLLHNIHGSTEASDAEDMGESPAIEVLKYRDPDGYFAGSTEARSPREPHVKYRVGQVIQHKRWGYRGVIVGWDPVARAPESWIKQNHPSDKPKWAWQPNYLVLVDSRAYDVPTTTYDAQDNLELRDVDERHDKWRSSPNYSVLVDTRDRVDGQKTYVAEENIQVISNTKIIHPDLEEYFEVFDGAQYIPRPWLKKLYPHD